MLCQARQLENQGEGDGHLWGGEEAGGEQPQSWCLEPSQAPHRKVNPASATQWHWSSIQLSTYQSCLFTCVSTCRKGAGQGPGPTEHVVYAIWLMSESHPIWPDPSSESSYAARIAQYSPSPQEWNPIIAHRQVWLKSFVLRISPALRTAPNVSPVFSLLSELTATPLLVGWALQLLFLVEKNLFSGLCK